MYSYLYFSLLLTFLKLCLYRNTYTVFYNLVEFLVYFGCTFCYLCCIFFKNSLKAAKIGSLYTKVFCCWFCYPVFILYKNKYCSKFSAYECKICIQQCVVLCQKSNTHIVQPQQFCVEVNMHVDFTLVTLNSHKYVAQ